MALLSLAEEQLKECWLFGGAISVCLPESFIDMSTMREIDDTEECWADAGSSDRSFVVEILGLEDNVADQDSPKFYWDDLVQSNDAARPEDNEICSVGSATADLGELVSSVPPSDAQVAAPSCWILQGVQRVSKFREQARNTVLVYMAVLRLPTVDSDIVIHYSYPAILDPASSSSAAGATTPSENGHNGQEAGRVAASQQDEGVPGGAISAAETGFRRMLSSLRIRDWGLFESPDMPS